jgi:hypothetical protein
VAVAELDRSIGSRDLLPLHQHAFLRPRYEPKYRTSICVQATRAQCYTITASLAACCWLICSLLILKDVAVAARHGCLFLACDTTRKRLARCAKRFAVASAPPPAVNEKRRLQGRTIDQLGVGLTGVFSWWCGIIHRSAS